jgi:lipopolysaccharide/colanic/teichoic acid biosynthesis glycosyltransferase
MKRLVDILVAAVGLALLSPGLLLIALAVRLTSRGPALFRQRRVGLGGRDFLILKFRTMTVQKGSENGSFDAGSAARVTKVGRILRATKLDELPQLWNVLVGDMSLVGPRPEVRKWVEAYPQRWAVVHTVRPGITDQASIVYRDEEEILAAAADPEQCYRQEILPRKLDLYESYVRTRSLPGDLGILWRTAMAVLHMGPATRPPSPTENPPATPGEDGKAP